MVKANLLNGGGSSDFVMEGRQKKCVSGGGDGRGKTIVMVVEKQQ